MITEILNRVQCLLYDHTWAALPAPEPGSSPNIAPWAPVEGPVKCDRCGKVYGMHDDIY